MTPIPTGTERSYDLEVTNAGGTTYLLKVLRDPKTGRPLWDVASKPEYSTQAVTGQVEPRQYQSWHLGGGYENLLTAATSHYCVNMDTRFARMVIMGPKVTTITLGGSANTVAIFEQSGSVYAAAGRYVKRINQTSDTAEAPNDGNQGKDVTVAVTSAVNFDGNTIVFLGNSNDAYEFTGSVWDTTPGAGTAVAGGYGATLWMDTTYVLARSYADGVAWLPQGSDIDSADWTAAYLIGDTTTAITNMTAFDRTVFVSKTDGLYYIDRTGRTPKVIDFKSVSTNNGKPLSVDSSGNVWCSTVEGYYRYNPGTGEVWDCSPWRGLPNGSPIYGRVTADREYMGWRWAWVYNGTDSYLMAGRPREAGEPGVGPYVWHGAIVAVYGVQVGCSAITTSTTNPRFYFGVGPDLAYFKLPRNGDNPTLDTNCFLGETAVWSPSAINVGSRRWYEGEIVEITTAAGHHLSGTPNHPILTDTGWKALGLLTEGDNVISCARRQKSQLGNDDVNDMDAPIHEVFDLLSVLGTSHNIGGVDKQFHGDGQEGDVDVVLLEGVLQHRLKSSLPEPVSEHDLAIAEHGKSALLSERPVVQLRSAGLTAAPDLLSSQYVGANLLATPSLVTNGNSGLAIADGDTESNEPVAQHARADTSFCGECQSRLLPFGISADQLADVVRQGLTARCSSLFEVADGDTSLNESQSQEVRVSSDGASDGEKWLPPIGITANALSEINGHGLAREFAGLSAIPNGDSGFNETTAQNSTPDTNGVGNSGQPLPILITPDKVTEVRHRSFAGHVYNLQTDNHWYIANSIIAHNCTYTSSGSIYMPADNWGVPGGRWCLLGWEVENEGLGSLTYGDFYVRLDGGSWQLLQSCKTSGRSRVAMPATGDYRFTKAAWRMDFTNAYTTSTPKITAVTGKAESRAPKRDIITTTIDCSDRAYSRYGGQQQYTGREILSALKLMQTSQPVTMVDYWTDSARTQTVMVLDVPERLTEQQGDAPAGAVAQITLAVQSSSEADSETAQQPATRARYGTARYGTDRYS